MSNHPLEWSPERTNIAVEMWIAGKPASQIANVLGGVSRNAVIGKMHRVGRVMGGIDRATNPLRRTESAIKATRLSGKLSKKRRYIIAGNGAVMGQTNEAQAPRAQSRPEAWIALEGSNPLPLLEMPRTACKWPIGEAPFLFCCEPRKTDDPSYCSNHRDMARGK